MEGEKGNQMPEAALSPKVSTSRSWRRKVLFSVGAAVFLALFILVFCSWQSFMSIPDFKKEDGSIISSKVKVTSVGEKAFGSLAELTSSKGTEESADSNGAYDTAANKAASSSAVPAGQGGGSSTAVDMVYPYEPTYYKYIYRGEEFTQNEERMAVLRRVTSNANISGSMFADALDFDLFNINKINKAKTSNLSFYEDREFGYRTEIDLVRETVSIYKNWDKWPQDYLEQLTLNDLQDDEEIIGAANAFFDDYQIDKSAYGTPEINKNFLNYYATEQQEVFIPEEISVIYPLVVDGKSVYESYGEFNGLSVNYDLRNNKVSSIYNLTTHNYQSSAYEAETDVSKILTRAQNIDGFMPLKDDVSVTYKTIELELDTPVMGYEILWKYEDNQNLEYLVPCLVFPVKENSEAPAYIRKRVIVPLIKDFLDQNNDIPVRIMKEGSGTSSVSGSSTGVAVDGNAKN